MQDGPMSPHEIAKSLSGVQVRALMTDERAIEQLDFRDRDHIIMMGLAKRAWPSQTGDEQWRTWITPLGIEVREILDQTRS